MATKIAEKTVYLPGGFQLGGLSPADLGLEKAAPQKAPPPGHFLLIGGNDGTGKTAAALRGSPNPIILVSLIEHGVGGDDHMQQIVRSNDIFPEQLGFEGEGTLRSQQDCQRILDRIQTIGYGFYGQPGTLVIDGGTVLWEICRTAILGKLDPEVRLDYAAPNEVMFRLFSKYALGGAQTNLIVTTQAKPEYLGGSPTGREVPEGWKRMMFLCHSALMTQKVLFEKKDGKVVLLPKERRWSASILRCKHNSSLEGTQLMGEDVSLMGVVGRL